MYEYILINSNLNPFRHPSWADLFVVCRFIGGFKKRPIPPRDGTSKSGDYEESGNNNCIFRIKIKRR